ncbi:hypothetical protein C2S51_027778 [Perilla frutescens var. frutescens]|nr:hypothetical protein C2S51_027778 [Perilla frutescens var. frutescens]
MVDRGSFVIQEPYEWTHRGFLKLDTCFREVISDLTLPATIILNDECKRIWQIKLEEVGDPGFEVAFTEG